LRKILGVSELDIGSRERENNHGEYIGFLCESKEYA